MTLLLTLGCGADDGDPSPAQPPDSAANGADPDGQNQVETSDTGEPDDDGVAVCLPCENEFGQDDKKLCPAPQAEWVCNAGCCEPVFRCELDADCTTEGYVIGQCQDESMSCVCVQETGNCVDRPCSVDAACADGLICQAGRCLAPPETAALSVRIHTRPLVLTPGASAVIKADGIVANNADIVRPVALTWTSDNSAVVSVDATGTVTGGTEEGEATITATLSEDQTASVTLRNVQVDPADQLTVVVVEDGTITPITGHYMVVDSATDVVVDSGALPADGVVRFSQSTATALDVHVFGDSHDWLSWLNTTSPALVFPVLRSQWAQLSMDSTGAFIEDETLIKGAGVVEGTIVIPEAYPEQGEAELTLTSLPFSSGLFDFNLESLIGPSVKRTWHPDVAIPGISPTDDLEMPGGLTLSLAGPAIDSFILAVPSGKSRVWTLGGRIDLATLFEFSDDIFDAFGGGTIDFGQLFSFLVPAFANFWSAVDVSPEIDITDQSIIPMQTTLRIPLALDLRIQVPPLPPMADRGYADSVFMLSGALTGDGLFTPLGLAAGTDTSDPTKWDPDGLVDGDELTEAIDPIQLATAPTHSGLSGPHTSYGVAVVAASLRASGDDPRPEGASAILFREAAGAAAPTGLAPGTAFLDFPMDSSWNAETHTVEVQMIAESDIQRVLFKGNQGDNWTVWLNGKSTASLPKPEEAFESISDSRTENPQLLLGSCFDLLDGVTADSLAGPGGLGLGDLLLAAERTSFVELRQL